MPESVLEFEPYTDQIKVETGALSMIFCLPIAPSVLPEKMKALPSSKAIATDP